MADDGREAAAAARTPGAKRAGDGEFYFDMGTVNSIMGGPQYSSVYGACVEGDRMMIGLMRMPAGTGSDPHSHPNEQWVYLLEGTQEWEIEGKHSRVGPGSAISVPAIAIILAMATADGFVVFFTVKVTSLGLHGITVY
jgi:quercetin dioxygenase-like cupin family protein